MRNVIRKNVLGLVSFSLPPSFQLSVRRLKSCRQNIRWHCSLSGCGSRAQLRQRRVPNATPTAPHLLGFGHGQGYETALLVIPHPCNEPPFLDSLTEGCGHSWVA